MMDLVLHFLVSYVLALFDPALAAVAGVGKEVFDYFGGVASLVDLAADFFGIWVAGWGR
jgi:hypothetical protein